MGWLIQTILVSCVSFFAVEGFGFNFNFKEQIERTHPKRLNMPSYTHHSHDYQERLFPDDFLFGVATSAYQIEGAWKADNKLESIWDKFVHEHPEAVQNGTGDVACDSYHQYLRDVEMASEIGLNIYRFSIAWTRVLYYDKVNQAGIDYYNNLIDALLERGIEPMVTMFHWGLSQYLQDLGGLSNPLFIGYFERYARLLFENFGDRVKYWITFNEALTFCNFGYGSTSYAPALNNPFAEFLCSKNLLLAHASVYHIYDDEYRYLQNGKVSMAIVANWYDPATDSEEDAAAAFRTLSTSVLQYAHPILSETGGWPELLEEGIAKYSAKKGFQNSVLPKFTTSQIDFIRGTADFIGLNVYTSLLVSDGLIGNGTTYHEKTDSSLSADPSWYKSTSDLIYDVPSSMYNMLKFFKKSYRNPEIIITENGWPTSGTIYDYSRIHYMRGYLNAILDAINEGVNVKGYCHWSLMDDFEWTSGYQQKFGLYTVDFEDPKRITKPNLSAHVYKEIISSHMVNPYFSVDPARTDIFSNY